MLNAMLTGIGGGRQLAYGHFQSVRPTISGVHLVVDQTATALYESQYLPAFICRILNITREQFESLKQFSDSQRARIRKELVGLQVQVKHLTYKRKYRVIDVTQTSADDTRFNVQKLDPKGKEIYLGMKSVVEYFGDSYPDLKLKYTHLSCVVIGSLKNRSYLPLDVCELVPDQSVRQNLSADQTATMIRESASQTPQLRLNHIKESAAEINDDSRPYLLEFGIKFSKTETVSINGRVLNAPEIGFAGNRYVQPNGGKWDMNRDAFYLAAHLSNWVVIFFNDRIRNNVLNFEQEFINCGKRVGMNIEGSAARARILNSNSDTIRNAFLKAKERCADLQLIIFVIDSNDTYVYEKIKRIGDCDQQVVTQCIKQENIAGNIRPALMKNLLLKVNTKLGGINSIVKNIDLKKSTMIVGVDCSHPGVSDRMPSKSVAACVGSYGTDYARYVAITRVKKFLTQELTIELREMMIELLKEYALKNNESLPQQIIIFRDGVSDGQFDAALRMEILELIDAFHRFRPNYKPLITFIVVQKRHHTRLFPKNPSEGVGRAKNVPPGLVIDTDIVSMNHFDYFLCSHEGIQGTSRPTHYYVLWDDSHFSSDYLQQLSYNLTHLFSRCMRSISCPAPVFYAHLAAYRAQRHIVGERLREESDSASFASNQSNDRGRELGNIDLNIGEEYRKKMYFC